MVRVTVQAELLYWAVQRAGHEPGNLSRRFPKLPEWLSGDVRPTLKQLERFAKAVHVPFGYLFLQEPPREDIPIPDFRTFDGDAIIRPSPNLLDIIYACQERQSWYWHFAQSTRQGALGFVGSADLSTNVGEVARQIRNVIGFDPDCREECKTWEDALRQFISLADDAGILIMVSGIVHGNTRRKLDPGEFREFALSDPLAPLIFINGADTKSAQMFTLAHELAHLWLDSSALSNAGAEPLSWRGSQARRCQIYSWPVI